MLIPQYNTYLFTDIWASKELFVEDYTNNSLGQGISSTNAGTLYCLLYAKYGNNPIANYDENQFRFKVWSIIFQYGPTWEKRLDIQKKIRELTDEELMKGSKAIYNHAFNPSEDLNPTATVDVPELSYINEQNTTNYKRSKVEALSTQWGLLKTDVTEQFLIQFKRLFKAVVYPDVEYIYESED